ncbi:DNA-processing protein DprA [Inhella sp.]|uniref:DNA-processing protein DprA n=1 Tax=Inhella sp. TaxID=1921806 RepID=UPI0035B0B8E5
MPARADQLELGAWLRLSGEMGRAQARRLLQACACDARRAQAHLSVPSAEQQRRLEQALAWLEEPGHSLLKLGDADYPQQLLNSPDPPLALFLDGRREQLSHPALAIVGTRHPTPSGLELARQFAEDIAQAGWVVVSGLALGIDGAAHAAALQRGSTWAVLGCGLDQIYPPRHRSLAARIREQGLLISEHAPGEPPLPANFPVRNRIIAGLSQGCLVVEAALRSGSLITARLASEAGREVFAVPGPIRSLQAQGCHQLIQQGAKLVQSLQDILDELPAPSPPAPSQAPLSAPDAEPADPLLQALGLEPVGLDRLQQRLGWGIAEVLTQIFQLELQGQVQRLPGERFVRTNAGSQPP